MKIAFDTKLRRPGCVLLQAALGGNVNLVSTKFLSETWLVNPTPDMKVFDANDDQIGQLIQMSIAATKLQSGSGG